MDRPWHAGVLPDGDDGWYTTWISQVAYRICADTLHNESPDRYCVAHERYDDYIARENHGRPFILASHSQGSLHAMRLLQERIAGSALQQQLVAAYIVGYSVPEEIERSAVPVCRTPRATGCLVVFIVGQSLWLAKYMKEE